MRYAAALFFAATLTACSTLPDVPEPPQQPDVRINYPSFVPINDVKMSQAESDAFVLETEELLDERLTRLRARAARLRATQIQ